MSFLVAIILVSLAIASRLTLSANPSNPSARLALAVATGTLGSAIAALLSALERRANGWELSNGWKYPRPEPRDKFQTSMVPMFVARPLLGSVMGVILYLYPWPAALAGSEGISVGFWGFVMGYLAKSFLEVVKGLFKSVFGK